MAFFPHRMDRSFYGYITAEALLFSPTHMAAARPAAARHMYLEEKVFFSFSLDNRQY
jgi:hypothetical protein